MSVPITIALDEDRYADLEHLAKLANIGKEKPIAIEELARELLESAISQQATEAECGGF